jgi:uncharacterized OB-fold protein
MSWRLSKTSYSLVGSKCSCGKHHFPKKKQCSCGKSTENFHFSGSGEIVSFTVIRSAPSGFGVYAPYTVGIIKLDEGPVLTGQILGSIENIKIGRRVRPVFRKVYENGSDGLINYMVKFEVV